MTTTPTWVLGSALRAFRAVRGPRTTGWGGLCGGALRGPEDGVGRIVLVAARIVDVLDLPRDRFEELVSEALDRIPPELADLIGNCVVLVEDDVPPGSPSLLGYYDGVPLTERGSWYSGVLPDRIVIYRLPTLRICDEEEDVAEEVLITVVHEIAHHFGISEERLHELGWG